jgi:hypothetical protein
MMIGSEFLKPDFTIVRRTETANLLALIKELMPHDCGKELIRLGGQGDGGYLIPDDLEGIEYCFSPGVGTLSRFESDLADLGIKSFLADFSVDGPSVNRPEFTFDKKFLGPSDHGDFITLASWKDKYIKNYMGDFILQMDIEGGEYEVILNAPDALLNQFRIMVIEFHRLNSLLDLFAFSFMSSVFRKILHNFEVAHIHPNNCSDSLQVDDIEIPRVMEFTFLNKRRVSSRKLLDMFPHKLDEDNTADAPALHLPRCWFS